MFARRAVAGEELQHEFYVPGSSFKGALRSAASRVASAYGFTSCGEIRPDAIERAHSEPCDVCKLFGLPKSGAPSSLFVSDLVATRASPVLVTRVRLEDRAMKAAEGALYTTEHLQPGTEFAGSVAVHGATRDLLGLLMLSMAELRLGRLGRATVMDLAIEEYEGLKAALEGTRWARLVDDLRRWLWG